MTQVYDYRIFAKNIGDKWSLSPIATASSMPSCVSAIARYLEGFNELPSYIDTVRVTLDAVKITADFETTNRNVKYRVIRDRDTDDMSPEQFEAEYSLDYTTAMHCYKCNRKFGDGEHSSACCSDATMNVVDNKSDVNECHYNGVCQRCCTDHNWKLPQPQDDTSQDNPAVDIMSEDSESFEQVALAYIRKFGIDALRLSCQCVTDEYMKAMPFTAEQVASGDNIRQILKSGQLSAFLAMAQDAMLKV